MDKLIKGLATGLVLLVLAWFGAQFYTQYRVDQLLAQIPTSVAKIDYKRVTALRWGELRFRDVTLNVGRHQLSAADASVPLVLFDWWPRELTLKAAEGRDLKFHRCQDALDEVPLIRQTQQGAKAHQLAVCRVQPIRARRSPHSIRHQDRFL